MPVLVVWEMVLNEQCRMGEEVEFIVAGVEEKLVSSHEGCAGASSAEGESGPHRGTFGAFFWLTHPWGVVLPTP